MVIKENQSVLDISTQTLGSLEACFDFCQANDLAISDDLFSNQEVVIPDSVNKDVNTLNYFAEKRIELASGYPLFEPEAIGIGVMIIEQTFIVT